MTQRKLLMDLLLCTNGSAMSKVALRLGVQIAQTLQLPATILGVVEAPGRRKEVLADVDRTLEQLHAAGVAAASQVVSGNAHQVIPAEANRKQLLTVVGALDPPLWRRLLRGPTMRHIIAAVDGPIFCVFRQQEPTEIKKVLICSGGLQHADAAIHLGAEVAIACKAQVTLLHVVVPYSNMPAELQDRPNAPDAYLESNTLYAHNLQQAVTHLEAMGLAVDFQVREGDPLLEILNMIHDGSYDLVVIGSHTAVTGPARLVGDITYRIVERAGCPVLIVRK